jgi:hypothetical protein
MQIKVLFSLVLAVLAMLVGPAYAQRAEDDADWKEVEVPAPPAFNKDKLLAIEMPPYVSLKFGVDPATLSVTKDGVVRYVMVATSSSGSINAMYEGIYCAKGTFKTYARWGSSGQWVAAIDPQWRPFLDNNTSKHALALARQGACNGRSATASSVKDIVNALKNPDHGSPQ